MVKNYSKKSKLKYVMLALACTATFSLTGYATACNTSSSDNDDSEKKTSKEDTQLLKNGNFEFFDIPDDAVYLIKTPLNWTSGGTSSYTMSGIIGTSKKAWSALTDSGLADKLDYNNDLDSSASNYADEYVDYNGMKSSDILYKNTYAALNDSDSEGAKELIENPGTHYNIEVDNAGNPYYLDENGDKQTVYEGENGDYYLDADLKQGISNVLMLHNYATSHNGIAQNYSSTSIELPANTAAEISLWVKTTGLTFNNGTDVSQDHGANITVTHTVGSITLDDFAITCINTEKLITEGKADDTYNGWVEYTVYVNACDFASSTITLKLGLGETENPVEGYAFFDDVNVTKFISLEDENCTYSENKDIIGNAFCTLSSDESEKIFKADSYERNGGTISDDRFSDNFCYLLDLASESEYAPVTFEGITSGLTVDADNYVSATSFNGKLIGITETTDISGARPIKDFPVLDTTNDLLAYVKAGYSFTAGQTSYYEKLNNALSSATKLPKLDNNTENNVLVMLSAYGAAYTSSFDLNIDSNGYKIVSFWVKTSDMTGGTAATVKLTEKGNKDNTANVTLDTTGVVTNIDDDNKDIYDGWVQCFFFINNDTSEDKELTVDISIGNTTIKDTTINTYKAGWVAVANMQTLDVDEDTFAYTGSGTYTASLSLSEESEKKTAAFDEAYGSQANEIKNNIVNPSSYTGVNGGSSSVVNNGNISLPYDDINSNANAGLINRDYFENYSDKSWYSTLLNSFNVSSTDALTAWNEIFGSTSVQPLIIVNQIRDYTDAKAINYGFIGSNSTVSANSYSTVSVKVKVSEGAIAYIYVVDTSADKSVLTFSTPSYSFYYDVDGNVLKAKPDPDATLTQQRENVLYTLREDGLYEDAEGNLFANIWNYTKVYKDETLSYYDKDGNAVNYEDLVNGETYYSDSTGKTIANHYLVTNDNVKVYQYIDGDYYYIVEGKAADKVNPFDTAYARYDYSELSEEYKVAIDARYNKDGVLFGAGELGYDADGNYVADKWITVNFVILSGSESKSYRLELWSGSRENSGIDENGNTEVKEGSTVIFDYSYTSISDDTLKSEYETEIIKAYQNVLASKGLLTGIATASENINYYKDLVEGYLAEGKLSQSDIDNYDILNNYTAHYYTYSLYDSANFQPFNKNVADENATGYDYSVDSYSETLAYLSVKDADSYMIFADYSTVDQDISIDTAEEDDTETDTTETDGTSIWLLASSILLVIALLITLISILIRDMVKKLRRKKTMGKNNYNQQRQNRYIRKLHINKQEFEDVDADEVSDESSEETSEEGSEEETVKESSEGDDNAEADNADNGSTESGDNENKE